MKELYNIQIPSHSCDKKSLSTCIKPHLHPLYRAAPPPPLRRLRATPPPPLLRHRRCSATADFLLPKTRLQSFFVSVKAFFPALNFFQDSDSPSKKIIQDSRPFSPPSTMTNDLFNAIEACKQNMLHSLDIFEQNMKRSYRQSYDNILRQLTELRHASMIELKTDMVIGQSVESDEMSLAIYNEAKHEFSSTILEEHHQTIINLSPTTIKDVQDTVQEYVDTTTEPMMQAENEMVSFRTAENMNDYIVVRDRINSEQYAFNSLSPTEFATTEIATIELATTKFAIIEFATTNIATSEVAMNKQRISKILVFDPGGISFIDMVTTTCIATLFGVGYFWVDLRMRTSFLKASAM